MCSYIFIYSYISLLTPSSIRYDSVADQCKLLGIQGVAKTPWELRREVCNTLRYVPHRFRWVQNLEVFDGNFELYEAFIAKHQMNREWTDITGVMVAATALYLGTNIESLRISNFEKQIKLIITKLMDYFIIDGSGSQQCVILIFY